MNYHQNDLDYYLKQLTYPVELRIPKCKWKTVSGYYDNATPLANDAIELSGQVPGVYATLNPVSNDLLARSYNRYERWANHAASDIDIVKRVWLPIDVDPVRASGISSTDEEHKQACWLAQDIDEYLQSLGFTPGIVGSSGNGAHCLYRVDLPNNPETLQLFERCEKVLALRFGTSSLDIDSTVCNAARIWKLPGTKVMKGSELGDRKHRIARLIQQPETLGVVGIEQLQALAELLPSETKTSVSVSTTIKGEANNHAQSQQWVADFIERHELDVTKEKEQLNRYVWELRDCPFCGVSDNSHCITVESSGVIGYKCLHNRCADKHWRDFRSYYEPDHLRRDENDNKMTICISGRQLSDLVTDAGLAILAANDPPAIFESGGSLVRLMKDHNGARTEMLGHNEILGVLSDVADWTRIDGRKKERDEVATFPPGDVVRVLVGKGADGLGLPSIKSIISHPVYMPDGSLITSPGYYDAADIYYHPLEPLVLESIPNHPTESDIAAALDLLLNDVLVDFPFVDNASRDNAIAMLLLPYVRPLIDGATPLHVITATGEGTGKSLLSNVYARITTGRPVRATQAPHDDAEWSKVLTSVLMPCPNYVNFDNIAFALNSGVLASALTGSYYDSRVLGGSRMVSLPVTCQWIATGNNIHASGEIARRMIQIKLDANCEHPELRTEYKHPDLDSWIIENRASIVRACLVLCRAWLMEGRPSGQHKFGSYESWMSVMGGICDVIGLDAFFGNFADNSISVNSSAADWRALVDLWWFQYKDRPARAHEIWNIVDQHDLLQHIGQARNPVLSLSHALSNNQGRIFNGKRIERHLDKHTKVNGYQLTQVDKPENIKLEQAEVNNVVENAEKVNNDLAGVAGVCGCLKPLSKEMQEFGDELDAVLAGRKLFNTDSSTWMDGYKPVR